MNNKGDKKILKEIQKELRFYRNGGARQVLNEQKRKETIRSYFEGLSKRSKRKQEIDNNRQIERLHQQNEKAQKYALRSPESRLFRSAKQSAIKRGLEFCINQGDIEIPEKCPLLGIRLTNILGKGRVQTNPSIDRKDNSKGYLPSNIWVISTKANTMKSDATKEELIQFSLGILDMYKRS